MARKLTYRSNPSRGINPLSIAALGVFLWAGYQLVQPILHGTAAAASSSAKAGTPAAATGGGGGGDPSAGWTQLSLTDSGGVPLEYQGARVRQSASWIAQYYPTQPNGSATVPNEYHPGAVALDGDGNVWKWTGATNLVGGASGGDSATLGDFAA